MPKLATLIETEKQKDSFISGSETEKIGYWTCNGDNDQMKHLGDRNRT